MASGASETISLRRRDTGQAWGFKMQGGRDFGLPLFIAAIDVRDPAIRAAAGMPVAGGPEKRSELVEESINPHMNEGTKYRNVTPKTYKILEQQLASKEPPASAMASSQPAQQMRPVHAQQTDPPRAAGKPSSIFDRKKQDRSDYLVAQGQTIQKTFGEQ